MGGGPHDEATAQTTQAPGPCWPLHQWKGGFPKPGPLCSSLARHGLFQGLMRAVCPLAGCIVPLSILGHMWFVVSCGDSLQCPSQALSPRCLWLSRAGSGGARGCLARGAGCTTLFRAQLCDPCSRILGDHSREDSVSPLLPLPRRMLPRRETRSKWTSRVRARHPPARLHGPTAQTCMRTLKTHTPP